MIVICKLLVILFLFFSVHVFSLDYKINGFATLVAGKLVSNNSGTTDYYDFNCPCFIADYNTGALYETDDFTASAESRAGVQLNVFFTDSFSFVTQLVGRTNISEKNTVID
jgi:hypothetical protein